MSIVPPVIVVQDSTDMYAVCRAGMVVNSVPVYHQTGLRYETAHDALRGAEEYSKSGSGIAAARPIAVPVPVAAAV